MNYQHGGFAQISISHLTYHHLKKESLNFLKDTIMKEIISEITMPWLCWKHKLIVWYFTISFCSLCITDDSPIWAIALVVLNFGNAARLIKKVPLPKTDDDIKIE